MEKIIKIGDYSIPVRSTAASLIKYKANFGRDGLADLIRLAKSVKNNNEAADGELNVDDIDELVVLFFQLHCLVSSGLLFLIGH